MSTRVAEDRTLSPTLFYAVCDDCGWEDTSAYTDPEAAEEAAARHSRAPHYDEDLADCSCEPDEYCASETCHGATSDTSSCLCPVERYPEGVTRTLHEHDCPLVGRDV